MFGNDAKEENKRAVHAGNRSKCRFPQGEKRKCCGLERTRCMFDCGWKCTSAMVGLDTVPSPASFKTWTSRPWLINKNVALKRFWVKRCTPRWATQRATQNGIKEIIMLSMKRLVWTILNARQLFWRYWGNREHVGACSAPLHKLLSGTILSITNRTKRWQISAEGYEASKFESGESESGKLQFSFDLENFAVYRIQPVRPY